MLYDTMPSKLLVWLVVVLLNFLFYNSSLLNIFDKKILHLYKISLRLLLLIFELFCFSVFLEPSQTYQYFNILLGCPHCHIMSLIWMIYFKVRASGGYRTKMQKRVRQDRHRILKEVFSLLMNFSKKNNSTWSQVEEDRKHASKQENMSLKGHSNILKSQIF